MKESGSTYLVFAIAVLLIMLRYSNQLLSATLVSAPYPIEVELMILGVVSVLLLFVYKTDISKASEQGSADVPDITGEEV